MTYIVLATEVIERKTKIAFKMFFLDEFNNLIIDKLFSINLPCFIEYSVHFFTLKMMLKYFLRIIHGRWLRKGLR